MDPLPVSGRKHESTVDMRCLIPEIIIKMKQLEKIAERKKVQLTVPDRLNRIANNIYQIQNRFNTGLFFHYEAEEPIVVEFAQWLNKTFQEMNGNPYRPHQFDPPNRWRKSTKVIYTG